MSIFRIWVLIRRIEPAFSILGSRKFSGRKFSRKGAPKKSPDLLCFRAEDNFLREGITSHVIICSSFFGGSFGFSEPSHLGFLGAPKNILQLDEIRRMDKRDE